MAKIPHIGFDNRTLSELPTVEPGFKFTCSRCGEEHELKAADDGSTTLLFYKCSKKIYLGALRGKLVIDVEPSISGKMKL